MAKLPPPLPKKEGFTLFPLDLPSQGSVLVLLQVDHRRLSGDGARPGVGETGRRVDNREASHGLP